MNLTTGELDAERQRRVPVADGAHLPPNAWSSTPRPGSARSTPPRASPRSASAASATSSMFGTLEPDVYFYGETIEKIGADRYRITKGGFTTCVQPTPRWEIVSGSATINLEDYVDPHATPSSGQGRAGVLPADAVLPDPEDDRATGFLLPTYGSSLATRSSRSATRSSGRSTAARTRRSSTTGCSRAATASAPSTATCSARRRRATSATTGSTRTKRSINGAAAPRRAQSKTIRGGLSQNLPFGLSARGRVDYFTDVTVQQTYNHNFYDASNSTRTHRRRRLRVVAQPVGRTARSTAPRRSTTPTNSTVSGQRARLHRGAERRTARAAADLRHASTPRPAACVYIKRFGRRLEQDLSLVKADFAPSIRAPLSTLPFLQVNATAAYRTTYYSESLADDLKTQIEVPITRNYGDMRVDVVGPVFSRVFNPEQRDRRSHEARHRADVLGAAAHRDRQPGSHSDDDGATTSSSAASRR